MPRTSEKTPNHDVTIAAALSVCRSGEFAKTTGKLQGCPPAGSKKGTGSNDKSFASASLVPLKLSRLAGLKTTHGTRAPWQASHRPSSRKVSVLSEANKSVGKIISAPRLSPA